MLPPPDPQSSALEEGCTSWPSQQPTQKTDAPSPNTCWGRWSWWCWLSSRVVQGPDPRSPEYRKHLDCGNGQQDRQA